MDQPFRPTLTRLLTPMNSALWAELVEVLEARFSPESLQTEAARDDLEMLVGRVEKWKDRHARAQPPFTSTAASARGRPDGRRRPRLPGMRERSAEGGA